jgi:hypothetical protein
MRGSGPPDTYDRRVLALTAAATGALVGLAVGAGLSVYVALVDHRARREGRRTRAEFRGSLVVVPALLALAGAGVGALLAGIS